MHRLIKKPHVIHLTIQGALTLQAIATLLTHAVSPEIEAMAFCLSSIAAVWAADVERVIRHPKLMKI